MLTELRLAMDCDKMPQSALQSSLNERIYLTLRASILAGKIGLGDRLVESQLAQQLAVSRTPIREAIRRLQQEQLLTTDSPDGVTIVEISLPSAISLYDCRISLEQLAVSDACQQATPKQVRALRQNLAEAEAVIKAGTGSGGLSKELQAQRSLKLLDLNYEFHRLIAESSQNPWLIFLLDQLANQVKLLRLQTLQASVNVREIQSEHRQVVEAIACRDAAAAAGHIKQHLEISQTRIIQIFESQRQAAQAPVPKPQPRCPRCGSDQLKKNGHRYSRQNYLCKQCGRQFLETVIPY